MAILYGTMQNGQLVAVEADAQGRLVAQLANPVDPSNFVPITGGTMTGNLTVPSLNSGPLGGFRNQIINGNFAIWARGTTFSNAGSGEVTADRWREVSNNVGAVVQQSTTAPAGFAYSLEADSNTGTIQHGIELNAPDNNSQFSIGSTWTLSVWCDVDITSGASMARFRRRVGDSSGSIEATAGVPNWSSTGETSNGFTRYKTTFTITGDASTGTGITCLNISFPSGGSVGARKFAGVQLEPGPVATPFEHRPIATELALCQRYYQTIRGLDLFPEARSGTVLAGSSVRAVVMRADPDETLSGPNNNVSGPYPNGNEYRWSAKGTQSNNAAGASTGVITADAEL